MEIYTLNHVLGIGGIAVQIFFLPFLLALFLKHHPWFQKFLSFFGKIGLWASLVIALFGTIMTLYFSEVLGILPCGLCWLQRVFLYPQVVLFGIAIWKDKTEIVDYAVGLSLIGALIALYQHSLQMGGSKLAPCISSLVADCSTPTMMEFGYITLPFLSFLSFTLIILFQLCAKSYRR